MKKITPMSEAFCFLVSEAKLRVKFTQSLKTCPSLTDLRNRTVANQQKECNGSTLILQDLFEELNREMYNKYIVRASVHGHHSPLCSELKVLSTRSRHWCQEEQLRGTYLFYSHVFNTAIEHQRQLGFDVGKFFPVSFSGIFGCWLVSFPLYVSSSVDLHKG